MNEKKHRPRRNTNLSAGDPDSAEEKPDALKHLLKTAQDAINATKSDDSEAFNLAVRQGGGQ